MSNDEWALIVKCGFVIRISFVIRRSFVIGH